MALTHDIDQAAGLRRLFARRRTTAPVVAFVAGDESCGGTLLLTHTAAALADGGARVLLIDECQGADGVHAALGIAPRGDLLDALTRDTASAVASDAVLDAAMQAATPGLNVLAAARLASMRRDLDAALEQRLTAALQGLRERHDVVLINAAVARAPTFSPLTLSASHLVMVVAAQGAAITRAYALLKQLCPARGDEGTHIGTHIAAHVAVTRAHTEAAAQAVFRNLATTATTHLGLTLDYLGGVHAPVTGYFAEALRGRLGLPSVSVMSGHSPHALAATMVAARGYDA